MPGLLGEFAGRAPRCSAGLSLLVGLTLLVAADARSAAAPCGIDTSTAPTVGAPSPEALRSARAKQGRMLRPDGPDCIVLTAGEIASLIDAGLDPRARRSLEIRSVRLDGAARLTLEGFLATETIGGGMLGPLAWMLEPREPLAVSGLARSVRPGLLAWKPDSFVIRSFAIPEMAIPQLIDQLTGGSDGTVAIPVPDTVDDVEVRGGGVTFYRRSR